MLTKHNDYAIINIEKGKRVIKTNMTKKKQKKLKKLIVFNMLLITIIKVVPTQEFTQIMQEVSEKVYIEEITSQAQEIEISKDNTETIEKNLELNVDSNLRILSNLTAEDYDKMLKGTALYGLGSAFEKAEKESNINGLYLMGLCCEESTYGTSNFAKNRNNLTGWGAYDSNPNKAKYFDSKEQCILFVANKLDKNYLTEGGDYFEGYTPASIDVHYCSDKQHAKKITNVVKDLIKKL